MKKQLEKLKRADLKIILDKKNALLEKAKLEIKIEASLEEVRAVALLMNKREDMLQVCTIISKQLQQLHVKEIRNVQTAIFYEDKGTYINYEYYSKHNKTFVTETTYTNHKIHQSFAKKMLKGNGECMFAHIKGAKVKEWLEHQRTTNVFIDDYLNTASSLNYYWFSLGAVALGISTYAPLIKKEITLFKRFLKVFELAYRRYLDIELAIKQAKEARIETALERVRAVAMAMRKPDDLLDICKILHEEFHSLGFSELRNAMINIHNDDESSFINYDYSDAIGKSTNQLVYNIHPLIEKQIKGIRSADDAFSETYFTGKDLEEWKKFRKRIGEKDDPRLDDNKGLYYYFYSTGTGSIGISTFGAISAEKIELLKRFRNVFILFYQRYIDISLAEKQAKEARIETALERVRAVAMAMRKPDELAGIGETLFTELKSLDFTDLRNTEIIINNDAKETIISYYYSDYGITGIIELGYKTNPTVQKWVDELKKADDAFAEVIISENEMDAWRKYREEIGYLPDPKLNEAKTVYYYSYSIGLGALSICSFKPVATEQIKILERFRNVFNLSYQRYTDIALSEAQAKESRLETALERVRAVAMAMKRSEELTGICEVIYNELTALGFTNIRNAQIAINLQAYQSWLIFEYSDYSAINMKKADVSDGNVSPLLQEIAIEMAKSKDALFQKHITGKEFEEWRTWRIDTDGLNDPRVATAHSMGFYLYGVESGVLGISTFDEISEDQVQTLKRFKNVFELSYKRYADVAQAEAQAKESRIEAALERVRSRSMGMQKSEELKEVIHVVYEQFVHLNIKIDHAGFVVEYILGGDWHFWIADQQAIPSQITVPYFESVWGNSFNEAKEKGNDFFATLLDFEEKNKFYQVLLNLVPGLPEEAKEFYFSCPGLAGSTTIMENVSLYIENFAGIPYTDEENKILLRFGKVFQQTYTRFLDLQKAEAHAREAQIETALEKVRSRSLAMHKSDELNDVVMVLFKKLKDVQIPVTAVGITIYIEGSKDMNMYVCGDIGNGLVINNYLVPYFNHPITNDFHDVRERRLDFFVGNYSKEEKNSFYKYLLKLPGLLDLPSEIKNMIMQSPSYSIAMAPSKNSMINLNDFEGKPLSENEVDILKRFARVFEQAYVRFLDLQKAEAQTREAQIEAALERVRAKAMAMHKSEDLNIAVATVFEELEKLNLDILRCGIGIIDKEKRTGNVWTTVKLEEKSVIQVSGQEPMDSHPLLKGTLEAWLKQTDFSYVLEGKDLVDYYTAVSKTNFSLPESHSIVQETAGLKQYYYTPTFRSGNLYAFRESPFPEDSKKIINRFASVLNLTFNRFLDLQKAEAQAREAQVQLALERARTQSMIMQHSNELDDTLRVFHEQVVLLGINSAFSFLWLPDEEKSNHIFWAAWEEHKNDSTAFKSKAITYPLDRNEPATAQCLVDWKSDEPVYSYAVKPVEVESYFAAWAELLDGVEKLKPEFFRNGLYYVEAFMKYGCFGVMLENDLSNEEKNILYRFSVEFERTYTRFLDLQKAEAQAREAQIQLALERVRARTMAMQKSEELSDAVYILFQQFKELRENPDQATIGVINEDEKVIEYWVTMYGSQINKVFKFSIDEPNVTNKIYKAWKENKKSLMIDLSGSALTEFMTYRAGKGGAAINPKEKRRIINVAFFSKGLLNVQSNEERSEESIKLLERFAAVFEQTYIRFLDLQKAEAQTRESQIELSLERVRAKTMAMHNSLDVAESVSALFDEVTKLGIETMRCGIGIMHDAGQMELWTAKSNEKGKTDLVIGHMDMTMHPLLQGGYNGWKNKEKFYSYELKGDDIINYYTIINNHPDYPVKYDLSSLPVRMVHSEFYFPEGTLYSFSLEELSAESKKIFNRFAGVFGQTYRRYLDLQKAEAQAREAQIELSLERVRAKTMAMHNSADVADAVTSMFNELIILGIEKRVRCGIAIIEESMQMEVWTAYAAADEKTGLIIGRINMSSHQMLTGVFNSWKNKETHSSYTLSGEDEKDYYKAINSDDEYPVKFDIDSLPQKQYQNAFYFREGCIYVFSPEKQLADEAIQIFTRFANAFGLTYRRYLDLQKAEAQAREAQIEASLERVRSRTMAMQKSDELAETAAEVFHQLIGLGIEPNRLYIGIVNAETKDMEMWATDEDGSGVGKKFIFNAGDNESVKKLYDGWASKLKSRTAYMQGTELENYFHYLQQLHIPLSHGLTQKRRVQSVAYFDKGFIGMASPDDQSKENIHLLERFAAVFNLTYTRFNDLQIAEAQTREAKIETALERVRARALAMQQPEELKEVADVMRHEMGLLGVEELETSSIYIHQDNSSKAKCWYAIKDVQEGEKKLVSDHFALDFNDTWVGRQMLEFYNSKEKRTSIVMQGENRKEWIHYCEKFSVLLRGFYGDHIPDRTYHLYKFSHGAIGAATPGNISEESWSLLKRAASVFSLAYSRFKDLMQARIDLQKLKEEKKRAEDALTDLQAAQKQLVQSEKMASLGELTAGIAHEIQNPLNFVNNFSEVNKEMLQELKAERLKPNAERDAALEDELINDVITNEEKINHHGKRADAIVKGMLQHSRSSSGQKEAADINVLCDEYVRLSYHGIRAKDNSFNATINTDFDKTIYTINIIPQDIGRVILNILTNAFYAVNEKYKLNINGYEPTVSITTKKINDKIFITVSDNGNGIPQNIVDKIFQPFFTTKPTGQGTGLGLSLSYDIIKSHGGEIKVETKVEEGSEFIVQLPVA